MRDLAGCGNRLYSERASRAVRRTRVTGGEIVERPQWPAMNALLEELRESVGNLAKTRQQAAEVTGTAWSPDRMIKAVVGPRGQLVDLDIDPRVFRTPNSKALSASILSTVRAAVEDANRKTREIMEKAMPKDRDGLVPRTDVDTMMNTHDADLARVLRDQEGEDRGFLS
jgi:DNA-binding protein YbaB